jgi:hypothetical protein
MKQMRQSTNRLWPRVHGRNPCEMPGAGSRGDVVDPADGESEGDDAFQGLVDEV